MTHQDQTASHVTSPSRKAGSFIALTAVALTSGLGASLLMAGFAHAEPLISNAKTLSETNMLGTLGFADERVLFGSLTFGFSLLAAALWHRSFRADAK